MRIVYKIIKIERSISRSKGKKEIETIILFMERNTRRSENDRDSLTFRGGYGYRSYRAVFSTDVGTVVPRKTRNDDRPIKLTPRPTILYLCSFRFFFFLFSSFLRANIDRRKRPASSEIDSKVFVSWTNTCVRWNIYHVIKFLNRFWLILIRSN